MKSKYAQRFASSFENHRFVLLIIIVLGFLIYSNTFHSAFHMDDEDSIVKNITIRHLWDLRTIWSFAPTRFVTYFTFALNYCLGGLDVFGFHLVNFCLHVLSAAVLWRLALFTWTAPSVRAGSPHPYGQAMAAITALIFVCHPLQTGAVTYIAQRGTCLAGFFYLTAMLFYALSIPAGKNRSLFYGISLGASVLSFFSKEYSITLPFAIVCYDQIFLKDLKEKKLDKIKRILPYFLLGLTIPFACITNSSFNVRSLGFSGQSATQLTMPYYLATQFRVLITYFRLLLVPLGQNFLYDYRISRTFFEPGVCLGMATVIALLTIAWRSLNKYPVVSFGIFFFIITLIPESSIFPIPDVIFEHRLYLPIAGFSFFLTAALFELKNKERVLRVLCVVVMIFSVLAYSRNRVWGSELSLWTDNVRKSPGKAGAYLARGVAYNNNGQSDLAIRDFDRAIFLQPNYVRAYNNRAVAYQMNGDLRHAIDDYDKVISINPNFVTAYSNRGAAYQQLGETDKALSDYTSAIGIDPTYESAYGNRAVLYNLMGKPNDALSDVNKAISINSLNIKNYLNRACIYNALKDYDRSLSDIRLAKQKLGQQGLPADIEDLETALLSLGGKDKDQRRPA